MIDIHIKGETSFDFLVDTRIYNDTVLTKTLYWYSNLFNISREIIDQHKERITMTYKKSVEKKMPLDAVVDKLNQDLADYKTRDIIHRETKDVRNILYIKAFANNDQFEDYNLLND